MLQILEATNAIGLAPIPLRIIIGVLFAIHGYPKINVHRQQIAGALQGAGIPPKLTFIVGVLEFFGGIALIVGFLTPLVAGLFSLLMIGTTVLQRAKFRKGFAGGYELDLVLLAAAVSLVILGAGAVSIDQFLALGGVV